MTLRQFDHGYWNATEIEKYAQALGLPSAHKLRKDELEKGLNHPETTHRRAPVDRYVYFLSDFMEANPGATMAAAIRAWEEVKTMDSPKNYRAFARTRD